MGSKFLGTGSNDLAVLQDGSFALNVATADVQSLVPSMPVHSSATRGLVSGLIGLSDLNFTPVTSTTAIQTEVNQVQNQSQTLAPAGHRDLWQYGTGAVGSFMTYSSAFDKIWTSNNIAGSASYSIDGGVSFSACVFDVVPPGMLFIGASPTVVVAVTDDGKNAYRSTDGINFTSVATPPGGINGRNIWWSSLAGLFIAGASIDAAHTLMTSPDGITWTPRAATLAVNYIKSNNSIIVATCAAAPYAMSSHDGITWTNSLTSLGGDMRALAWSDDQKLWAAARNFSGELFTSPDGVTWTSKGSLLPSDGLPGDSLIWVANGINRWYASVIGDAYNYSLLSSPDTSSVFVGGYLDGATQNTLPYSLAYDSVRNRFYMGVNTNPLFAYSTPRPFDIKALGDNIRIRGLPVSTSLFSSYATLTVTNTTVETSLIPGSSTLGTTYLQAPMVAGSSIEFKIFLTTTSVAGDTLTVRIKANGTTIHTITMTIPAGAAALVSELSGIMTVLLLNSIRTSSKNLTSGALPALKVSGSAFTSTSPTTFTVTGQWGANASSLAMNNILFTMHMRNGA